MDKILDSKDHKELIRVMNELINILQDMDHCYFISKHLREANDWYSFLVDHNDIEELQSLENGIVNRYVFEYDVLADCSNAEKKRHYLMRELLNKFGIYLH
jgi:predicted RNA-binding protein with EMAP domain